VTEQAPGTERCACSRLFGREKMVPRMQFPQTSFDNDSVALMGRVCDEVWREVQAGAALPADEVLRELTARVMAAVAAGERDPARLKAIALDAVAPIVA
jgi:hypothetical protein